jgi:hypothetical protein
VIHIETAIETCAAHGCDREPAGAGRFCLEHTAPTPELCRAAWRALTAAQEPGTRRVRLPLRRLAAQLNCHLSTVWRAVATLERLGYVRRVGHQDIIVLVGLGEAS